MESKKPANGVSRRKFFAGLAAGMGMAGVAMAAGKSEKATTDTVENNKGPVLYRRTAEAERYYKTLYQ